MTPYQIVFATVITENIYNIYSTEVICQYFSVQVTNILKKNETERTEDEISTLHQLPDVVKAAEKNAERQLKQKERVLEVSCYF